MDIILYSTHQIYIYRSHKQWKEKGYLLFFQAGGLKGTNWLLMQYFAGMQFEEENNQEGEGENIEEMLDDLGLGDDVANFEASKKDSTVFIIDCSQHMVRPLQGEEKSQLQLILQGYYSFLQRKIIANASDKVGLILYNVKNTLNSINQDHIYKVHSLDSEVDARRIKEASLLFREFEARFGGLSSEKVSLNYVLWEYGAEISTLKPTDYYLRVFLFTADDCPHPIGDQDRQPSIKRAQELASKNVQIELFPIRTAKKCFFDVRKFYQEIITFDPDQINSTVLDSSSKILDLQERLRQKEFKKRTLNRLTMKIGKEVDEQGQEKAVEVGVKIYSLYTKAKRPAAKKVDAKSNKLLQRVTKKLNSRGEVLFDGVVGTYYPLGGEKIKVTKEDMNRIKNLQSPGMTLIGFKPRNLIKPYHNLRTSYFLYPDEEHITGSSQFFDSLITELAQQNLVGIVKLVPRNNQQLRFAALFPQEEKYDPEDHFQTPPGFNMVILPFAQDLVNFVGEKTIVQPSQISKELIQITKLLINNLTIHDFDFRDFESPALQKFYSHLQAHALNEKDVELRPDLLEPDIEGFNNFRDVIDLVKETVRMDCEGIGEGDGCTLGRVKEEEQPARRGKVKKEYVKEAAKSEQTKHSSKNSELKEEEDIDLVLKVEGLILNSSLKELKVADLKQYLRMNGMSDRGKKEELIDRILVFMENKNAMSI